jgi:hypothetical protein
MGTPNPTRSGRGRPRITNIDWSDQEAVAAYHRERRLIRKQQRAQREAAELDSDIVWGEDAARLWGLKPSQFYYRASHKWLPGVVMIGGCYAASRKARDAHFAAAAATASDTASRKARDAKFAVTAATDSTATTATDSTDTA